MITFRQALDAMGIPYVDDGSPSLDYEMKIYNPYGDDKEIKGMVNDHENKQVILGAEQIGT
jgi:hypothetical protein